MTLLYRPNRTSRAKTLGGRITCTYSFAKFARLAYMLRPSLIFVTPVLITFLTSASASEPLKQGERDYAMSDLHASRKMFLDSVANLTPAQWSFKAGPDRWSIAECAEHIAVSEDFIWGITDRLIAGPPSSAEMLAKFDKNKDQMLVKVVQDRSQKFQAPEPIQPKKLLANPAEYVAKFTSSRDAHIHFVDTTTASLRDRGMPHPAAGPLDAYQWILLLSGHTARHTLQILEVKADPNFPKN